MNETDRTIVGLLFHENIIEISEHGKGVDVDLEIATLVGCKKRELFFFLVHLHVNEIGNYHRVLDELVDHVPVYRENRRELVLERLVKLHQINVLGLDLLVLQLERAS